MSLFNAYVSLSGALDATIKQDEPLSHYTSFRIGGKASLFAAVHSHVALVRVLEVLAANRVDWVLLGKGSNILVSDEGYNGCVIVLDDELSTISVGENNLITAGAGALTARVCNEAMKAGLSGLEMCAGIPGTIGGALSMNAGTRHDWIGKAVRDCVVLKPGKGLVRYDASEIEWGYRYTTFAPDEIILEATFALTASNRPKVALGMDTLLQRRRNTQPTGQLCCGSVFKNPGSRSAGALIEECGLKGATEGGAQISDVHANFIVNTASATASDVIALMRRAHDAVQEKFDIDLQPEVKLLGFGA